MFCVRFSSLCCLKVNADEPSKNLKKVKPFTVLNGHTSAVQSISSEPSGDMVCSGSWDCSIKLWAAKEADVEDDSVSLKKRKSDSDALHEKSQLEVSMASLGAYLMTLFFQCDAIMFIPLSFLLFIFF